jgi:hypothetical protein
VRSAESSGLEDVIDEDTALLVNGVVGGGGGGTSGAGEQLSANKTISAVVCFIKSSYER